LSKDYQGQHLYYSKLSCIYSQKQ